MMPGGKRLLAIYRQLDEERRRSLEEYAEFLLSRSMGGTEVPTEPINIVRPSEESVINAIKRLTLTYPMLDPSSLFNDTSRLMSQHVMQGRFAKDVIDELETLFARRFEEYGKKS